MNKDFNKPVGISHIVLIQGSKVAILYNTLISYILVSAPFCKMSWRTTIPIQSVDRFAETVLCFDQPSGEGLKKCLIEKQSYKICNLMPLVLAVN